MKLIKYLTFGMLAWYVWGRWHILDISNQTSIDWLNNSFGNFIAIVSALYTIIYALKIIGIDNKKITNKLHINYVMSQFIFILTTTLLALINGFFLFEMVIIFVSGPTFVNFLYLLLDISIFFYYVIILNLCAITYNNKISCCECSVR